MGLPLVGLGLLVIFMAILIGPFISRKIEQNFEPYLLVMSLCAVAISRSWHLNTVEAAVKEPLLVGAILIVLLAGSILTYRPNLTKGLNLYPLDGMTLKVIFFEIVVVLGLLASLITPILPFFVLVEVVNHLPLKRDVRAKIMILAVSSICLGAATSLIEEPYSSSAIVKMQGALSSANFFPLELQNLYLALCILALGLVSIFWAGEELNFINTRTSKGGAPLHNVAIWSVKVCMFAAAILLVGAALGVNANF